MRLLATFFMFLKRKMEWTEALTVSTIMTVVIFACLYIGGNKDKAVNYLDISGIVLFLCGSFINTCSEFQRHIWKKNPENKGKLYTQGFFKYSIHINYFGDVVLFSGFALITNDLRTLIIPLVMALNFMFFIIPSLDAYLGKKYGKEFDEYARRTKKLIPYIY